MPSRTHLFRDLAEPHEHQQERRASRRRGSDPNTPAPTSTFTTAKDQQGAGNGGARLAGGAVIYFKRRAGSPSVHESISRPSCALRFWQRENAPACLSRNDICSGVFTRVMKHSIHTFSCYLLLATPPPHHHHPTPFGKHESGVTCVDWQLGIPQCTSP